MATTQEQKKVRVYLEDGSYVLSPTESASSIVGITEWGDLICTPLPEESYIPKGMYVGLTGCCGATATGCDGYIGCRGCYRECDSMLGAPMRESDIYIKVRA